jgi:hypothetical protein
MPLCIALGIGVGVATIFFYNEMPVGEGAPPHTPVKNYVKSGTDFIGDTYTLADEYPENVIPNTAALVIPGATGPIVKGMVKGLTGPLASNTDELVDASCQIFRQTGAGGSGDLAHDLYDAIRNNPDDIQRIAKNTGFKPENIAKIKQFLFFESHLLDRYVDYGVPAEFRQFDSSAGIANAWQRLEKGNFTQHDIDLLKHEIAERWFMNRYGAGYNDAHNAAQGRFPSPLE